MRGAAAAPLCCEASNGLFSRYNSDVFECCDGDVVEIGICVGLYSFRSGKAADSIFVLDPTQAATTPIDECAEGTHSCSAGETCIDTDESYSCICTNQRKFIIGHFV